MHFAQIFSNLDTQSRLIENGGGIVHFNKIGNTILINAEPSELIYTINAGGIIVNNLPYVSTNESKIIIVVGQHSATATVKNNIITSDGEIQNGEKIFINSAYQLQD